jgi:hypothetical protein
MAPIGYGFSAEPGRQVRNLAVNALISIDTVRLIVAKLSYNHHVYI